VLTVSEYGLDLVGVQEVRWEGGGTEPAGEHTLCYGKGNENHKLGTVFFVYKRINSTARPRVADGGTASSYGG
jgi:hypothetical protein